MRLVRRTLRARYDANSKKNYAQNLQVDEMEIGVDQSVEDRRRELSDEENFA